jgi:hypothetical protein
VLLVFAAQENGDLLSLARRAGGVKKAKVPWRGWQANRRGCGTTIIELTGDPLAGQGMLRHKSLQTTLSFYKKKTPLATLKGVLMLSEAANKKD